MLKETDGYWVHIKYLFGLNGFIVKLNKLTFTYFNFIGIQNKRLIKFYILFLLSIYIFFIFNFFGFFETFNYFGLSSYFEWVINPYQDYLTYKIYSIAPNRGGAGALFFIICSTLILLYNFIIFSFFSFLITSNRKHSLVFISDFLFFVIPFYWIYNERFDLFYLKSFIVEKQSIRYGNEYSLNEFYITSEGAIVIGLIVFGFIFRKYLKKCF